MRAHVTESRMPPATVIEPLDVIKDRAARFGARVSASLIDQFDFERGEEALRHRIVPAVSTPAHAAQDAVLRQHLLILPATVLAAARSE